MPTAIIIIAVLILVILILLITNIKIVPQSMVFVVERLGAYQQTWETGLHFKVPFIDRVAKRVSLKEQVVDFKPQPVITRDNVTMQIDSVVFYQITDAKLFTYGVERPISAIENLTATTLRNIIGELEMDHTLTSRDVSNTRSPPPSTPPLISGASRSTASSSKTSSRLPRFRMRWRSR